MKKICRLHFIDFPVLLLGITSILLLIISCDPCKEKIPDDKRGNCNSVDTLHYKLNPTNKPKFFEGNNINITYRCNQIIFDPSQTTMPDTIRELLRSKCFELKRTCSCGPKFELWEYPSVEGIDVGTSVSQGPKVGVIGKELFYNLVFDLYEPPKAIEKTDSVLMHISNSKCLPNRIIKIAIVDSGVDPQKRRSDNNLVKRNWTPFNSLNPCIVNNNLRGLTCVTGYNNIEPDDSNGHGTAVNGVVLGESSPNILINIPIKFLNVRITNGHTKTGDLFDAMCGLYYALDQDPDIINISWGFKYFSFSLDQECIELKVGIERIFNQFFKLANQSNITVVAGIGNDSLILGETVHFYPGGLAYCNDNLISVGSVRDPALSNPTPPISMFSNCSTISDNMATVYVSGENVKTVWPKYIPISQRIEDLSPDGYVFQSGTSFAAPLVSRIVALMISNNQTLTPSSIKQHLLNSTTTVQHNFFGPAIEYRVLNVKDVVEKSCIGKYNLP